MRRHRFEECHCSCGSAVHSKACVEKPAPGNSRQLPAAVTDGRPSELTLDKFNSIEIDNLNPESLPIKAPSLAGFEARSALSRQGPSWSPTRARTGFGQDSSGNCTTPPCSKLLYSCQSLDESRWSASCLTSGAVSDEVAGGCLETSCLEKGVVSRYPAA
jgi:hypothetical protein